MEATTQQTKQRLDKGTITPTNVKPENKINHQIRYKLQPSKTNFLVQIWLFGQICTAAVFYFAPSFIIFWQWKETQTSFIASMRVEAMDTYIIGRSVEQHRE